MTAPARTHRASDEDRPCTGAIQVVSRQSGRGLVTSRVSIVYGNGRVGEDGAMQFLHGTNVDPGQTGPFKPHGDADAYRSAHPFRVLGEV